MNHSAFDYQSTLSLLFDVIHSEAFEAVRKYRGLKRALPLIAAATEIANTLIKIDDMASLVSTNAMGELLMKRERVEFWRLNHGDVMERRFQGPCVIIRYDPYELVE